MQIAIPREVSGQMRGLLESSEAGVSGFLLRASPPTFVADEKVAPAAVMEKPLVTLTRS